MELGVRIAEKLDELGISQSELARRAGIPQTTINSLIKKPRRSSPHLIRIARELNTTPAYLTGEVDDPGTELPVDPISGHEREWVDLLRELEAADRKVALAVARALAKAATVPTLHEKRSEYQAAAA